PIFANETFLKSVSDEYGWLGGFDDSGKLRCILPYTILRKLFFRMVRFRVETILLSEKIEISEEKSFLNSAVSYFKSLGVDTIIPATTNTIFRTFPDKADAAPYGSYVIDLKPTEDILWHNIDRITRQNINTAQKKGVIIQQVTEQLTSVHSLITETFQRSKLPFMNFDFFKRYVQGLGENGKVLAAVYQGVVHSSVVFAFSNHCAYAVYAGNIANQHQGANKLLYWEAIRCFKQLGIDRYDFVGARINPEKGSKQEAINLFKKRFGAQLIQGYMWKYALHPLKHYLYCLAAHVRSGGDIVDTERHKLKHYNSLVARNPDIEKSL
ncbi:MAG: peptidoglycan bridge formation glycyltransferase FemA/FemB family protein, partial [Chitinivibrionales bacterium]|nr:peptidoglycan bridge formation glycyltransferase FemA/FemB family protein [Chitinivibrionales bacterium]